MAAVCSERLTGLTREVLTHLNPVSAALAWIISHFCMHFFPLGPAASERTVSIHLEGFVLCWLKVGHLSLPRPRLVLVNKSDLTATEPFITWTCLHDEMLSDQTDMMLFFLFFSTTDCQGKHFALFFLNLEVQTPWINPHCVTFRYDSSGETDKPLGRTGSYARRETRLTSVNKQEQDSTTKDYKKVELLTLFEHTWPFRWCRLQRCYLDKLQFIATMSWAHTSHVEFMTS